MQKQASARHSNAASPTQSSAGLDFRHRLVRVLLDGPLLCGGADDAARYLIGGPLSDPPGAVGRSQFLHKVPNLRGVERL